MFHNWLTLAATIFRVWLSGVCIQSVVMYFNATSAQHLHSVSVQGDHDSHNLLAIIIYYTTDLNESGKNSSYLVF